MDEMDEKVPEEIEKRLSKEERKKLRQKWLWSPWRVLPSLVVAYAITGVYLWMADTPDAWLRALAPVLTIATFLTMRPLIKKLWFMRMRSKLRGERGEDDVSL